MYGLTVNCVNYVPGRGVNSTQQGPARPENKFVSAGPRGGEYLNPRTSGVRSLVAPPVYLRSWPVYY